MPQLGDIRTAMKMRESITDIATSVVKTLRPEDRIGTVFSYNTTTQMAEILFPGETNANLVQVHYGKHMRPKRAMVTNFSSQGYAAVGDIVRVSGKPGSYWISDYVNGEPARNDDTDWIDATLLNGWLNYDIRTAQYRRLNGIVYCQGIVKSGLYSVDIFQLPLGFRPKPRTGAERHFPIVASDAFGFIRVWSSTGGVQFGAGSNGYVDLSTVIFPADY
jgi:hypothetical protein